MWRNGFANAKALHSHLSELRKNRMQCLLPEKKAIRKNDAALGSRENAYHRYFSRFPRILNQA